MKERLNTWSQALPSKLVRWRRRRARAANRGVGGFRLPDMNRANRKRLLRLFVILNVAGMVLYVYLSSTLWIQLSESGEPVVPADTHYSFFLWPLCGLFALLDLVALVLIVRRVLRGAGLRALSTWLAVAALWATVAVFAGLMAVEAVSTTF